MSVVVIGRQEGLTTPLLSDDYHTWRDHVVQLGQEDGVLHMLQKLDMESEPEGSDGDDFLGHFSHPRRSPSTESILLKHRRETAGVMKYGCSHYRRRCRIRAPCCGEVFDCRHCHNDAKNLNELSPKKRHDIPRHAVKTVICSLCSTEQEVQQICKNCGVCMGEYFCGKCRFFDDETRKGQYHCDACGICRIGGRDNFFHCQRCGCCYSIVLQKGHPCVEKSMHHNCPVCFEYLFDSMKDIMVMPCGHTMHLECSQEMQKHSQFSCPICSKSVCDMSKVWEQLDAEVAASPMPEAYQNKKVWILCNDCSVTSEVSFHFIGHKCGNCNSYNTRQTNSGSPSSRLLL